MEGSDYWRGGSGVEMWWECMTSCEELKDNTSVVIYGGGVGAGGLVDEGVVSGDGDKRGWLE